MQASIDGAKHITSQEMSPQVKGEIVNVKQGQSQTNRKFDSLEQEKESADQWTAPQVTIPGRSYRADRI